MKRPTINISDILKSISHFLSQITKQKDMTNLNILKRNIFKNRLRQCLTTRHIIFLCVGNMIGTGLYKLTGEVINKTTGPAIILCYILVGLAATLSATCYSEMESRMPVVGSAYSYTYAIVGEVAAFVVGWDMIFENMIGAAILAKSWSETFDELINGSIRTVTLSTIGSMKDWTGSTLFENANGPDILAAILVLLASFLICTGAERSANFISCFAISNLLIIVVIIGYGLSMANVSLWTTDSPNCARNYNVSGGSAFLPYGPYSIIEGSGKIYFAFIGFNWVACAGEETKNPEKALPQGTMISIGLVALVYLLMTATLTLLVPYCNISSTCGFAMAFVSNGHDSQLMYVLVTVSSLCAMTTVLFGILFAMPRTIYAMSTDGLLFGAFKILNPQTQTPIWGLIIFGSLSSLLALFIRLDFLLDSQVISVLSDFSIVACCVIMLRYWEDSAKIGARRNSGVDAGVPKPGQLRKGYEFLAGPRKFIPKVKRPVSFLVLFFLLPSLFGLAAVVAKADTSSTWFAPLLILFLLCSAAAMFFIYGHHQSQARAHFRVPFVPFLPALSLFLNLLLINHRIYSTTKPGLSHGIRIVWVFIGLIIYFAYGKRHSKVNKENSPETHIRSISVQNTSPQVSETILDFRGPNQIRRNSSINYSQNNINPVTYTVVAGN